MSAASVRAGDVAAAFSVDDERWMRHALVLAQRAEAAGEVPVGAVLVRDGALLGEGANAPIGCVDPSAHAEMLALRAAAGTVGNYRLPGSTLYVTLEPCPMCAGALVHARVARVVFAAADPRTGAGGSVFDLMRDPRLNHRCVVEQGLLRDDSAAVLRAFFRARRGKARDGGEQGLANDTDPCIVARLDGEVPKWP